MSRKLLRIAISPSAESTLYQYLCIGIIYSFLFWTLLNSICCILLFACWLLVSRKKFDLAATSTRLMLLFASLYLCTVVGMFYTHNTAEGFSRLQEKVPILLFPLIFGTTSVLNIEMVRKIAKHFVAATVISSVCGIGYGLLDYFRTGLADSITGKHLLVFPDMYPYLLGLCALLSMIMVLSGLVTPPKKLRWITLILLSLFILLLGTRVIIGCWLTVALFSVFTFIPTLPGRLFTACLLLGFTALLVFTIPPLRQQWNELIDLSGKNDIRLDQDASLGKNWGGRSIRKAIWECSGDLVRQHWVTGVGTGDIQDSLQQAYEDHRFYFASRYNRYNAHNQYLQTLIGHGAVGLCILVLCILVPPRIRKDRMDRVSRTCYLAFLSLFCIICFTEVILDINKGVIWYSFFNSIFAFIQPANNLLNIKKQ